MANYKHLTQDDRYTIQNKLNEGASIKSIATEIGVSTSTVSREIKKHIQFRRKGAMGMSFNNCRHRNSCNHSGLCENPSCKSVYCRYCSNCSPVCDDFEEEICERLSKSPYVCNGCELRNKCRLEKRMYYAISASKEYKELLTESRSGVTLDEDEIARIDKIVSPLVIQGQSIRHIYDNNKDTLMISISSLYDYIDSGLLSVKNIDLPRKVTYRPRRKTKDRLKIDKKCRIGRTYEDFQKFMSENPDTAVVEMDSVVGGKDSIIGKVLLTIHFRNINFQLAFIRESNDSKSVIEIFDRLYFLIGLEGFDKLFPVILTDNGSEFSNPTAIEFDAQGTRRTRIFYCDPGASWQKGSCEVNHEQIRRIVPQGKSFDDYTQEDINLMMNHINSYGRKKLNTWSPYQMFKQIYGEEILSKLGAIEIAPNEIVLRPELLKK